MEKERLVGIQWMRALAAVLVIVYHIEFSCYDIAHAIGIPYPPITSPLNIGVDMLFIISGFIIVYIGNGLFQQPGAIRSFLTRRILRIVPLYWIYTTIMLVALMVSPSVASRFDGMPPLDYILSSYFFIAMPRPDGGMQPLLLLGWTVNYEMYFYALFALCLLLPRTVGFSVLMLFFIIAGAMGAIFPLTGSAYFYGRPILWEFVIGIALGIGYLKGWRLSAKWFFPLVGLAVVWIAVGKSGWFEWTDIVRVATFAPAAGLLMMAFTFCKGLSLPQPFARIVELLGDSSYTLYLSHLFILGAGEKLWVALGFHHWFPLWVFGIISFAVCIVGGLVFYYMLEAPLARWSRGKGRRIPS